MRINHVQIYTIFILHNIAFGCGSPSDNSISTDIDSDSTDASDTGEISLTTDEIESDWVVIPAGEFVYGSPETQPCRGAIDESQVDVIITRPYKMASTEITRKQWRITGLPDPSEAEECDNCAEGYVNWFDALYWLNSLSKAAGLTECYDLSNCVGTPSGGCLDGGESCRLDSETREFLPEIFTCTGNVHIYPARVDCPGYRLPTAAEWEWAAHGGTTTATYNGDITEDTTGCLDDPVMDPIGWYCGNSDKILHPVGELLPNAYGLYDILGNVGEWTSDVYTGGSLQTNEGKDPPLVDPVGYLDEEFARERPLRGGRVSANSCRSAVTTNFPEQREMRSYYTGFRPVRTILD